MCMQASCPENIPMRRILLFLILSTVVFPACAPKEFGVPVAVSPAVEDLRIARQIEDASGSVQWENGRVVGVDLAKDRTSATDELLHEISKLDRLRKLRLSAGPVSPDAFVRLDGVECLEELYLQDLAVESQHLDDVLRRLPNLNRLTLRRYNDDLEPVLDVLEKSGRPLKLGLIETNLDDVQLRNIFRRLEKLESLDVRFNARLTADGFKPVSETKNISELKIGGFGVNDETLETLVPLAALTSLTVDGSMISAEGFAEFSKRFASAGKLETLVLNRNMTLLDDALISLERFPKLKRLTVCDMMCTGGFLARLAENENSRPRLEYLSLRKTLLTAEAAETLEKFLELRRLNLSGIALTSELAESVAKIPSLKELDITDCLPDENSLEIFRSMNSLKTLRR